MDREDRNRKENDSWDTYQRYKGADQESDASDDFSADGDPSHDVRQWNTRRLKDASERFWALGPFR